MGIEAAIRTVLMNDATVSGLVGTRIFPDNALQGVQFPNIVYHVPHTAPDNTLDGPGEFHMGSFDFNCYATTYDGVIALSKAVKDALNGHRGGALGVSIQSVLCAAVQDIPQEQARDPIIYRRLLSFDVNYQEQ